MLKNKLGLAKIVLTVLFLHFFIYSCKENIEEDFVPIQEQAVNMVSHEEVPSIISKLYETVNPAPIDETRGSVAPSSIGDINMTSIMEVLDSLEHRNYTFLVDDNDDDPFTFTNLIVKKRADGSVDQPYLLEYRVDSTQRDEFLASKFAMDAFTGQVTKRFLDGSIINNSKRGQANLGVRNEFNPLTGDCDREYDYNGGSSGGVDNYAGPGGTNTFSGGSTLVCWDEIEAVTVPMECDEYTSRTTGSNAADFDNCWQDMNTGKWYPNNGATTTTYVMTRKCSYIRSQGIEDDSMCPLDESEGLGILNNGFREYLNTKPLYSTASQLKDYMEMVASELSQYADTEEAALAMFNTSLQPLSVSELQTLSVKSWNVYRKLEQTNFRIDWLSTANQKQVAADAAFVELYPEIKERVNDPGWPLSTEEWEAVWEILKPMLGEVLIEAIPGGGLALAFRDIVEGSQNMDAIALTTGLVGVIIEFFPAAKVFRAVYKVARQVRKGFKFVKYGRRYLDNIGTGIKGGLKPDMAGTRIRFKQSNGSTAGYVDNGTVEIITSAAKLLADPSGIKRMSKTLPTSGGFINSTKVGKGRKIKATESGLKAEFDRLKGLNHNDLGNDSEALIEKLFNNNDGYQFKKSHLPGARGNQGFDGVFIKRDASGNIEDILINETKQVSSAGGISLNSGTSLLPEQMSDGWVENVISRMRNEPDLVDLANDIKWAKNNGKITKVITGIDKHADRIVILNMGG